MIIRHLMFRCAPTPTYLLNLRRSGAGISFFSTLVLSYSSWWEHSKAALTVWHRNELADIDYKFALQDAERELLNAREEARRRGIGPLDPQYPDIYDFYPKKKLRK